ncbi:MAG: MYXO-CTERM sorting domain-containing protein [Labilithrix sp.]|nr:MYXO-CTERM sorting domain-containing protein [Labilithrix sp.]
MRALTLRTAVRFGMMMAVAGGVSLAAADAYAGDVETGGSRPASGSPNTSVGAAELKYEHTKGLPTSIETGFKGLSFAQVNVGIKIDPVVNGGPLYSVEMPKGALVEASWGTDKQILLRAQNGAQTDGLVTVRHTLTPSIDFKFSGFGLSATFSYNANDLINKVPGSKFFYDSKATQAFAPWGFTAVDTKLNAPDMKNATLFSMNMNKLPDFVSNNVTGSFGVRASTKPTFSYKTTKVFLSGADGEISSGASELTVPAVDGDYMELMAAVEGEMSVKGAISVQPFVYIGTILEKLDLDTDLGIDVFSVNYTVPTQKVNFETVLVHIPMPNVHAPARGVDIGMVKVGGRATKTIEIENSGEKEAVMTFKSSDSQFSVPSETVTVPPKSTYELIVKFSPDSASPALSEITISSNDADSPEQKFKVGANGADVGAEDELPEGGERGGSKGPEDASGCGCKAAGTSPVPGWAGLGLAGLGAAVLFRRRRNAA